MEQPLHKFFELPQKTIQETWLKIQFHLWPLQEVFLVQRLTVLPSLPYVPPSISWLVFFSSAALAIGNALFSPTQSSLLTFATNNSGYELGAVMGAQEGYSALARIIGPLLAAYIWSQTVEGIGLWTYHTCFRVAGLVFVLALILQMKIKSNQSNERSM